MLMSFPHLFSASTNQWRPDDKDRDPATDTSASPDLWRNFGDFYQRAQAASKLAFDASRAKHGNEFKALIGQLRAACNGCHAAYLKTE
jgi:cytochrome c556